MPTRVTRHRATGIANPGNCPTKYRRVTGNGPRRHESRPVVLFTWGEEPPPTTPPPRHPGRSGPAKRALGAKRPPPAAAERRGATGGRPGAPAEPARLMSAAAVGSSPAVILSDRSIREEVAAGRIRLDPF